MEAAGELVVSMATASPGVLVSAPEISPTTLGVSISRIYLAITAINDADPTNIEVSMIKVLPLDRND